MIKYLLTSTSRNSSVKLQLVSSKHNKVYACSVQRSRCVSDHTDWYYEAQDQFPNAVLVANVEIVNVLEDIRLKILNSKGRLVDFLTLDDTEPGRSSLGFRVSWISGGTESGKFLDSIEVLHVTPGGCADGLVKVGDFILEIEGRPLYQCNEDEIISLFRGEEIVGSACSLLVSRAGRRLNVQIKRTSNAQSSDSITLQNLVEHLEHQMPIADTTGLRATVQQIKQHAGIMEKRRSQREALVAERIRNTQAEILACITAAESHLRSPRGSERLNIFLQTQTESAEELVSVLDAFKGPNLKDLTDFLDVVHKYKWESGECLKLRDLVRLLEVLKDSNYVSVEQAAQALSHYGDSLSIVIGQSSETIKAFAIEGLEAFAAERTARLHAEKIAQEYSEKVKMLQAEVDKYAALLDRRIVETTRRHTDQVITSSDRPDETGLHQGGQENESRRSRDVEALKEANRRLVQDLAEARAQAYKAGSASERMLLEKNAELQRQLQDSVPRKLYDDLERAVSPFLKDNATAASAASTTPGHLFSPSLGAHART